MLIQLAPYLPKWLVLWADQILLGIKFILILILAGTLRWLLRRLIVRISVRYDLPAEVRVGAQRLVSLIISFVALLAVLSLFGVSGGVLWTAFTGFAAVSAVAFFAAWSVLTNVFCAVLLIIARPFKVADYIELLDGGDRPGLRGQVVDMSVLYVTLREVHPGGGHSDLRIPNALFFQRSTRRWHGMPEPLNYPAPAAGGSDSRPPAAGGGSSILNFP